jgi:hypothetical protein
MGDGRWEMGDGRWEMGDGRWEIRENGLGAGGDPSGEPWVAEADSNRQPAWLQHFAVRSQLARASVRHKRRSFTAPCGSTVNRELRTAHRPSGVQACPRREQSLNRCGITTRKSTVNRELRTVSRW